MQDLRLFEYAVIRIVPRPEREEFVNAGVILYCPEKKFLGMRAHLPEAKLQALDANLSLEEVNMHLQAFEEICCGKNPDSPIAQAGQCLPLSLAHRYPQHDLANL
jgi:hypothetical protein